MELKIFIYEAILALFSLSFMIFSLCKSNKEEYKSNYCFRLRTDICVIISFFLISFLGSFIPINVETIKYLEGLSFYKNILAVLILILSLVYCFKSVLDIKLYLRDLWIPNLKETYRNIKEAIELKNPKNKP